MLICNFPAISSESPTSFYFYLKKKVYLFILQGEGQREGERERERERIPSRLCTVSMEPDVGLEPTNCENMT